MTSGWTAEQAPEQAIARALARSTDTRRLLIGRRALDGLGDYFGECFGRRHAVVVADETTYDVAGAVAEQRLRAAGRTVAAPIVYPAQPVPHADYERVLWLKDRLAQHNAIPVAVGAGTINDLVKLASRLAGRPYLVVATAASMDGYASFGAAITRDGFKQTMSCPAPAVVVADVDVLAAAPPAMTAAGFGDLMGKITAGADWLLADALGVEPIDQDVWDTVQPAVRRAVAEPERVRAHDAAAVERLFLSLVLSGLAMQAARSSRPASGADHQLSHLWEMRGLMADGRETSHGFKVGVGTVAIAALYEQVLAHDLASLTDGEIKTLCRRWPGPEAVDAAVARNQGDPELRRQARVESRAKHLTPPQLKQRLRDLRERWPALRERLRAQLLSADEVRRRLEAAGCPTTPEALGLTRAELRASYPAARQIRRRYTVLDMAAETALLEPSLDTLFGPGGYWSGVASSQ